MSDTEFISINFGRDETGQLSMLALVRPDIIGDGFGTFPVVEVHKRTKDDGKPDVTGLTVGVLHQANITEKDGMPMSLYSYGPDGKLKGLSGYTGYSRPLPSKLPEPDYCYLEPLPPRIDLAQTVEGIEKQILNADFSLPELFPAHD